MINPCGSSCSGPYYEVILYFFIFIKHYIRSFLFFSENYLRDSVVQKARLIKYKFLGVKVKLGSEISLSYIM